MQDRKQPEAASPGIPSYRHRDFAVQFATALLAAGHADSCAVQDIIDVNYKTRNVKVGECDCGYDADRKAAKEYLSKHGRQSAMNITFKKLYGGKKA